MKTVDIFTAQKVSLQYEVATLFERIIAWILDFILIIICMIGFNLLSLTILNIVGEYDGTTEAIASVIISCPWVFYHYAWETFNHGRSPGKLALGLQVVKLSGENVSSSDYFLRWCFRLIDVTLSSGGLALILIATSSKGQRVGDALANTSVIRVKPRLSFRLREIMDIQTTDNYTPVNPGVKYFSDKDMLLIKEVLERFRKYHGETEQLLLHDVVVKVCHQLQIGLPDDEVLFLKTVLKDYIVLSR